MSSVHVIPGCRGRCRGGAYCVSMPRLLHNGPYPLTPDSPLFAYFKTRLRQASLFAGLPEAVLEDMLGHFQHETWGRGVQGEASTCVRRFYLLIQGRVEIIRTDPATGKGITLFLLEPGDGFDVVTLLDGRPHDAAPVAVDDLHLLWAPVDEVRVWIEAHPGFNRNFMPYLGERLRAMEDLASDLALYDTVTRLARLILRYSDPGRSQVDPGPYPVRLINDLSHESLAHMIGSVRQVVNRHLQELQRQGVVHGGRGQRVVRDLEALHRKAQTTLAAFGFTEGAGTSGDAP